MSLIKSVENTLSCMAMPNEARCKDPIWQKLVPLDKGLVDPVLLSLSFRPIEANKWVEDIMDAVLEHCVHVFAPLMLNHDSWIMELAVHWEIIPAEDEELLDFFVVFNCINDRREVLNETC